MNGLLSVKHYWSVPTAIQLEDMDFGKVSKRSKVILGTPKAEKSDYNKVNLNNKENLKRGTSQNEAFYSYRASYTNLYVLLRHCAELVIVSLECKPYTICHLKEQIYYN